MNKMAGCIGASGTGTSVEEAIDYTKRKWHRRDTERKILKHLRSQMALRMHMVGTCASVCTVGHGVIRTRRYPRAV